MKTKHYLLAKENDFPKEMFTCSVILSPWNKCLIQVGRLKKNSHLGNFLLKHCLTIAVTFWFMLSEKLKGILKKHAKENWSAQ